MDKYAFSTLHSVDYLLKFWGNLHGAWRAKSCILYNIDKDDSSWMRMLNGGVQCKICYSEQNKIRKRSYPDLYPESLEGEIFTLPRTEFLVNKVQKIYNTLADSNKFISSLTVLEIMAVLRIQAVFQIDLVDGITTSICPGKIMEEHEECRNIVLVRRQINGAGLCTKCQIQWKKENTKECHQIKNRENRISPDSRGSMGK